MTRKASYSGQDPPDSFAGLRFQLVQIVRFALRLLQVGLLGGVAQLCHLALLQLSLEQGLELLGHLLQGVVQFQLLGIQLGNEIEYLY